MQDDEKTIKATTVEEFLAQGGKIERLPSATDMDSQTQSSTVKKAPELLNFTEADLLFGEDRSRNKTKTKEDIVALLAKVVKRNPNFLEQYKIPQEYVTELPEELRSAARIKTKKTREKIDASFIDPELAKILAKESPQALKDIGLDDDEES